MKFLTQFKTADVVTISNGFIQAIKGPIAYFGFNPKFANVAFALDAKMFVATMKKFNDNFYIKQDENSVIFYDHKQEVEFIPQPPEILLDSKNVLWTQNTAFVKAWNIAQKFVNANFPGVRVTNEYLEVVSDESIVRFQAETHGFNGIFAAVKLPASLTQIGFFNNKLWFAATPVDLIAVSALEVMFPATDRYFDNWPETELIPASLKERFVETNLTVFDEKGVKFVEKEKATASIEGVHGSGRYAGKLFGTIVANADRYAFRDNYMAFEGLNFKGVIASV